MAGKCSSIPVFRTEASGRAFRERRDSSEKFGWGRAMQTRVHDLKLATKAGSLRLPGDLLERIKTAAGKQGIRYQSPIEVWLPEKVNAA